MSEAWGWNVEATADCKENVLVKEVCEVKVGGVGNICPDFLRP